MTIPAELAFIVSGHVSGNFNQLRHVNQIGMAANTVFLHHAGACIFDLDHMRLGTGCKNGGMPGAVAGFEIIFSEKVIVRNVTIAAGGNFAVAAVFPGGILRIHDVAVDAGFRLIGKVGRSAGNMHRQQANAQKDSQHKNYGQLPLGRGRQSLNQAHSLIFNT